MKKYPTFNKLFVSFFMNNFLYQFHFKRSAFEKKVSTVKNACKHDVNNGLQG